MTSKRRKAPERRPEASGGLHGSDGAIVAGGDVTGSSTQYIQAERAFVLPSEAYAPIPDDAVDGGISNIGSGLFVGRAEELGALDEAFARPGGVVVHAVRGLGGVGKSALAAHWAARRPERLRWWLTADSASAVEAGLTALARALQPALAGLPAEVQSERAIAWLAGHDGWLLVLDNVEEPRHIRPLLDRVPGGRILITTRRATGWHHHATTLSLDVFDPAEAWELFTRVLTHHGLRCTEGAEAACEELGHLALAVEQAAAYCAETGTSPRTYLDMLARWPADMFAAGAVGGDAERTITRIWHLTLDRFADTPLTGDLLRILAWYAPDRIPRDLLDGLAEPPRLAAAIGRLTAYSMITDNADGTLTVHRVLQTLARTPDADDPHRRPEAIDHARGQATTLLTNAFPADSHIRPDTWPRCRSLLPHADALTHHHAPDRDTLRTALVLYLTAQYRTGQSVLAPAIQALHRALAAQRRIQGSDHPDTLTARNFLAYAHFAAGDLGRATPLFERILEQRDRVLGSDHPDTLTSRSNLAYAYEEAGDLKRAIPLHEHTLRKREQLLGEDHRDTLTSRNNLAVAYRAAGDLERAIPLFERTLEDRERVLGKDHPGTLASCRSLGVAYTVAGDLERAIPLLERTLHDAERVLGSDHSGTLASCRSLGGAYTAAGDLERAIPLLERALHGCERVLGNGHPSMLATRRHLASAYEKAGDLERAISLLERTVHDSERVLGSDRPKVLIARNDLARAYEMAGHLGRAIQLFERTLHDSERVLGQGHPLTTTVRTNLERARST
ncbi:FxSxx-COOH system tetratricopeptide repeat protein [Streptomyces sp. NPDC048172]|uniref:FxSxx-COOH system tetratricopeptide repeat protein n=1 Tax=Streptomyces sp. NPDC048172 TaxID=3365505 RepID=UPI0037229C9B